MEGVNQGLPTASNTASPAVNVGVGELLSQIHDLTGPSELDAEERLEEVRKLLGFEMLLEQAKKDVDEADSHLLREKERMKKNLIEFLTENCEFDEKVQEWYEKNLKNYEELIIDAYQESYFENNRDSVVEEFLDEVLGE